MPKGAVEYSFLQVVDAHVTGRTAMSFYWGRTLGRAAEEAKPVFEATEAFNHARHPKTGRRCNWNDFQGWFIPAQNNPFIEEVKQALVYQQTQQGLADQVLPLADAERGAGLQGRGRLRRAQEGPVLRVEAEHRGHLLQDAARALLEHRQRAAAGRQPVRRHRARPVGAGANRAEGGDRQDGGPDAAKWGARS